MVVKRKYGLHHRRIWICGGSAGGHLALWTLTHLPSESVEGCISVSAIGDPSIDFVANPGRYDRLFAGTPDVAAMDPRPAIMSGLAPLLCTHADADRVVPIASHRAFETAYRVAGNPCEFFEYRHDCEPNEGGHCIWRPGSDPHRLLDCVECRIRGFVTSCRKGKEISSNK